MQTDDQAGQWEPLEGVPGAYVRRHPAGRQGEADVHFEPAEFLRSSGKAVTGEAMEAAGRWFVKAFREAVATTGAAVRVVEAQR